MIYFFLKVLRGFPFKIIVSVCELIINGLLIFWPYYLCLTWLFFSWFFRFVLQMHAFSIYSTVLLHSMVPHAEGFAKKPFMPLQKVILTVCGCLIKYILLIFRLFVKNSVKKKNLFYLAFSFYLQYLFFLTKVIKPPILNKI